MKELVVVFILVALAVLMVMAWRDPGRFRQWARALGMEGDLNGRRAESEDFEARERLKQLEAENAAIKERLATLEAIVTDPGYELDQRIRKLG
ncbi:hypothetical protein [Ferrimonas balearica]|uniref:hypothetical protein n=1 Tax=Ferrimonas balearica TaxID=44012 RepID=UPI001C98FBEE|nr:hypothetical protein [Ferrimonas balearica]MBY5992333.1 hypothetical protein [Ferrimonas balearica]